jgi:threonine dehydratase
LSQLRRALNSGISLENIERAAHFIDPVFLNTPQFQSDSLSNALGMELVLKVETINPIRSFKGRGADFLVSCLPASSARLVCASAGNFGQGLAYAARKRGFEVVVFAAESANALKITRMRELGAEVRLLGSDFDEAKHNARVFAEQTHGLFIQDGREPEVAEGAGTIAVEICRWQTPFDVVLVPLGDGALLGGIGRWMKTHSPATRVIGVGAAGAPAMAISLQRGEVHATESTSTIADGIAVRVPIPESLFNLKGLVDEVLLVQDDSLVEAMRLVFQHHGLVTEPAGVAGLAAVIAYKERFRGLKVVTPLCGGNLTADQMRLWLLPTQADNPGRPLH